MDSNVLNIVNGSIIKVFSGITLIDVTNDKVSFLGFNPSLGEIESNTYEEYYEKLKKIIHPDYLSSYFEKLSLNNLKDNGEYEYIRYSKLSANLAYDSYLDLVKKVGDNKVLVLSIKCDMADNPKNDDSELSYLTADLIVDIESVLDKLNPTNYEASNALKYIAELLNNIKIKNDSVLKKYQEKIIVEVNKTKESLLIVDDDTLTRNIFKKIFEKDFGIIEAQNGAEAVELIENNIVKRTNQNSENIVGMFLDLKMPVMDGFGVLDYLKEKRIINRIPVVIISADDAKETKESVYTYDIADMIEKPFNYELIKKRVGNMIRMYSKSNVLNDLIRIQEQELKNIVKTYAKSYLIDYQSINDLVAKFGRILLNKYAMMNDVKVDTETILRAAQYYDISLDFIPRKYLDKIDKLNYEEKDVVLNYPNMGLSILKYVTENETDSFVKYAMAVVKYHNERYDGSGFPLGVKDDAIPYYVYLINIALEYTNYIMTHPVIDYDEIQKVINSKIGTKYSPKAIEVFNAAFEEMK